MTIEEAKCYWRKRLKSAESYSDEHWDAEERHAHRDYIDAMLLAVKALSNYTDVEMPKQGQWVPWAGNLMKCTYCGHEYVDYVECENFCGNCGAKMNGEVNK